MRLQTAVARYLRQLDADGKSPFTIEQVDRHLRFLVGWVEQTKRSAQLARLDHLDLAEFLVSRVARVRPDGRPKAASSVNALRSTLRSFFAYVEAAGYASHNAARLVRRARCSPGLPRPLSEEQTRALLETIVATKGRAAQRDHMLVLLMLRTGLRISSALGLGTDDVDLQRRELTLRSMKNNRPDAQPIPKALLGPLRRYLKGLPSGPLFPGAIPGRAVCSRQVRMRLGAYARRAGIVGPVSPHRLRHSFATDLLRRCGNILVVQHALRHRSAQSSTVYAQLDRVQVRDALDRLEVATPSVAS